MSPSEILPDPAEKRTPIEAARLCKNCRHKTIAWQCEHPMRTGFSLVSGELNCGGAREETPHSFTNQFSTGFCGTAGKYYEAVEKPESGATGRFGK